MKNILYILLFTAITSCSSDSSDDNAENSRDLNEALSFSELIQKRMNNDTAIDNSVVLINTEVEANFTQPVACADVLPCTNDIYEINVADPIYQGSSFECSGDWLRLVHENKKERLIIDLNEHTEFYTLTEADTRVINFYAHIEFVERQAWCSDQINLGLKITLQEGEEAHILDQFQQ